MSKKSKKILAYLMFVAALCGTPAVSEARGGSGGQVATEKASVARRENSDQGFSYRILKNYGPEILKWLFLGSAGYGTAKVSDIKVLARYVSGIKNADEKKLKEFEENLKEEARKFGIEVEKFEKEKSSFEQLQANAIKNNEKLFGDKAALGMKVNSLLEQAKKDKETIEELKNRNQNLNNELVGEKNYNVQLFNLNNEDNKKIDALLSGLLPYKMSGELDIFGDDSWKKESYNDVNKVVVEPYSGKEGVKVVIMKYDGSGNALNQQPEWLTLPADGIIDAIKNKVGIDLANISFKDIGLDYCGVSRLARYAFVSYNDKGEEGGIREVVAAYFPVKSFQLINNVENDENNEENNENVNNEENNENVNNEENNENVNNEENNENVNNEGN